MMVLSDKKHHSSTTIVTSTTGPTHHREQEEEKEKEKDDDEHRIISLYDRRLPYVCVHCHTPCEALYRRLSVSFASSIQAIKCHNCGQVVDPYMEQEPILVVIDCILSRVEAYRHVLYNEETLKTISIQRILQLLLGWSICEAYFLKWQGDDMETEFSDETATELRNPLFFEIIPLALSSLGQILFQWSVMQLLQSKEAIAAGSRLKLFWAVFLPCSFTVVTIFVSIWENTKAVRMLGILLISYWQGTSTWVVTKDLLTPSLCLVGGIVWRILVSLLFPRHLGCFGYELRFLSTNLCFT